MSPDRFDFELGVIVAAPVKAVGRVKMSQLPSAKIARTTYTGAYEGLHSAWASFDQWLKANEYEKAENLWELYTVGPHTVADPACYRTELNRPLKS